MTIAVQQADARIGTSIQDLDTPTLVVDLDMMERNIAQISQRCREGGVSWRPHSKGLKAIEVARRAINAGAIGITCAKVGDAEFFVNGGIEHILIANEVIGDAKLDRVAQLQSKTDVIIAIDSEYGLAAASAAAVRAGTTIPVVIEVDSGMGRCGVAPGEPTLALARSIENADGIRLVGIMGWEGHTTAITDICGRETEIRAAVGRLVAAAEELREFGHQIDIVSAGGTATYMFSSQVTGVTEIQAGGGIYGDRTYVTRWDAPVECSLVGLVTVISRPTSTRIVTDAGRKALNPDMAGPLPRNLPNVKSYSLHAEHGVIALSEPADTPRVGDKIEIMVGYGDWTVFLHDEVFGHRNGRVEEVWTIAPRIAHR